MAAFAGAASVIALPAAATARAAIVFFIGSLLISISSFLEHCLRVVSKHVLEINSRESSFWRCYAGDT